MAGSLILGAMIGCGALGVGIGLLVGAAVPLGLVGFFVGLFAGVGLVITRFRDL